MLDDNEEPVYFKTVEAAERFNRNVRELEEFLSNILAERSRDKNESLPEGNNENKRDRRI